MHQTNYVPFQTSITKYQMGLNVQSFQIQATLKKFFTPELCINKTKWALVVFFLKKKKVSAIYVTCGYHEHTENYMHVCGLICGLWGSISVTLQISYIYK